MTSGIFVQKGIELSSRSRKILLIDEEAGDLKILRLTLEGQGFEVLTYTSYEAGLLCLEAEPFDLVVVSQGSQAFEGRTVLERAMQLDRRRPVLVLTRCMSMQCYLEAMQLGAVDYIEKPVPPAELLRFVRTHVASTEFRIRGAGA